MVIERLKKVEISAFIDATLKNLAKFYIKNAERIPESIKETTFQVLEETAKLVEKRLPKWYLSHLLTDAIFDREYWKYSFERVV